MSVLLLHAQGWTGGTTVYELHGPEAWKVLGVCETFESRRRNPVVTVTIFDESLTDENCNENLQEARGRLANEPLDLFATLRDRGE